MRILLNLNLALRANVPLSRLRERVRREGNGHGVFHYQKWIFAAPVIFLLYIPVLCRAETAPSWNLQQLMLSLAQVKEAKAKFVERKFLGVLKQPLESTGTLLFQAPDHVEKHTLTPKLESLILDHGVLTIEIKTRNIKRTLVIQEYPAIWAFVESIRSTLAGDLATLERFYKIKLEGDSAHWKVQLLPIEAKIRDVVSEVLISGHGHSVDSIETFELNGDHSLMKVVEDTP